VKNGAAKNAGDDDAAAHDPMTWLPRDGRSQGEEGAGDETTLDLWFLPSAGDHVDAVVAYGFDAVGTEAVRFGAYMMTSVAGVAPAGQP
jgi:hypothetical protein